MSQDIFDQIVNGEKDAEFLIENDDLVVFADINPQAPVHYLVVPRRHIDTVDHVKPQDAELLGKMVLAARDAAGKLGITGGYKLVFNVGNKGGQVVPHIHLHILGGWDQKQSKIL